MIVRRSARPRRIRVSPSGPPVSATTTRSRASHLRVDALLGAILLQRAVDLVGEPEQSELAKRGEVAEPEVVRERGIDPRGGIDQPLGEPIAERLRCEVDDLDLVGRAKDRVRHGLALHDSGDLLDDIVERLDVLDVDGREHRDAGIQQGLDVLPALVVLRSGGVGVGELVDQGDRRMPGENGVEIHLAEHDAAVVDGAPRDQLETLQHGGSRRAVVGFHDRDGDITTLGFQAATLLEHRVGLADAGGCSKQHPKLPSSHLSIRLCFA